jgi:hypothetical protein
LRKEEYPKGKVSMHVYANVFVRDPLLQILNLHSEVDWSSPFVLYAAAPSLESAATVAFLAS